MSCLELRKAVLTDPSKLTPDLFTHLGQCPSCAAFARLSEKFEGQLLLALKVPVPPQLQQRVLLHQRALAAAPGWSPDRRRLLSAAAGVAVAAVGMLGYTVWRQRGLLADELIAHALEPHPPTHPATSKDGLYARARNLFAEAGVRDVVLPDGLVAAWLCPMYHVVGPHLRLARQQTWADLMFRPGLAATGAETFSGAGLHGRLHTHPKGVLAVVSPDPELLVDLTPEIETLRKGLG